MIYVTFFLNNSSISGYLFCIQTIIDSLSSIGEHVSESDHVDIVLDGLPDEFESLIIFVSGKFELMSTDEVATLLLAHETRIARKTFALSIASINIAEGAKPNFSPQFGATRFSSSSLCCSRFWFVVAFWHKL